MDPEHSHIPSSRTTPWAGVEGAPPLPDHYWRSHSAFIALAYAAAVTTKLRLGTGVTLVAQRDPIWLAKEVATLDPCTGGRVIFGIGYGWNKEEMASHGVGYKQRRAVLREKILMMKSLWTEEEASFTGELPRAGAVVGLAEARAETVPSYRHGWRRRSTDNQRHGRVLRRLDAPGDEDGHCR